MSSLIKNYKVSDLSILLNNFERPLTFGARLDKGIVFRFSMVLEAKKCPKLDVLEGVKEKGSPLIGHPLCLL